MVQIGGDIFVTCKIGELLQQGAESSLYPEPQLFSSDQNIHKLAEKLSIGMRDGQTVKRWNASE